VPVATISNANGSNGLATGVAAGTTNITAALGSVNATVALTVSAATLMTITLAPRRARSAGLTQQYTATGHYGNGTVQDITTMVTWSTSASSLAVVSNSPGSQGLVTTVAMGTPTVTATLGGVQGSAILTVLAAVLQAISVTPQGQTVAVAGTLQFTATGVYSDHTTTDVTTSANWQSSVPTVATVGNNGGTKGLATGKAAGTSVIRAASGSLTGTANLTVQ
jgi:hypothetical protein